MPTLMLATEGQTDIDVLTVLLKKVAEQCRVKCDFAPPIFPSGDATAGRGWAGLKTCLEAFRGVEVKTEEQTQKDTAIFALMDIRPPSRFNRSRWQALFALYENLLPIIQIDGDIAEEIGAHHPDGTFTSGHSRAEYCRQVLQHWTGLGENTAIWCIPVQCLEAWFLSLYSLQECRKYMPEVADYESISSALVYNLLCSLGHQSYFDKDKDCHTVDKIHLSTHHSQSLAGNLDTLCEQCPSAQRFVTDVTRRLTT